MWDSVPLPEPHRGRLEVRCATLMVPVDHADPGRCSLDLAMVRVRAADDRDRIGSLVLNPGGPGLSGLDYMPLWVSWLPDGVLARFDVVSFDPRGAGRSAPIRCGVVPADQATAVTPSLEGKTPERREVDVDDAAFVIGCNDSASGAPASQLRAEAARMAITYPRFGEYGSWWLFRCTFWMTPHPVLPTTETVTASPLLVIATEAHPATPYYGGVARALGPSTSLLTVSGGGHTPLGRSPCVAEHVTLYLVELRLPGGHAC